MTGERPRGPRRFHRLLPQSPPDAHPPRFVLMKKRSDISRREFVTDVAKGGAALSAFHIVPRHVLGGPGHTPPSALLNIAIVGCGGMGSSNAEAVATENLVAFCDVDPAYMQRQVMGDGRETRPPSPSRAMLRDKFTKATKYVDFRE